MITIKSNSGRIIHHSEKTTVRDALLEAIAAGADLSRADLRGADLSGADLSRADLSGADLSRADLSRADLRDADLSGAFLSRAALRDADLSRADLSCAVLSRADLSGADLRDADLSGAVLSRAFLSRAFLSRADLRGADLSGAVLSRADLRDADLRDADLSGAVLIRADLRGADLSGAVLSRADLRDAVGFTAESVACEQSPVPVIPNIHRAVLAAATADGCALDMSQWHKCETTHCRAGWVVHLAGKKGRDLEREIGTAAAAMRIYLESDPGYSDRSIRLPKWFCSNEEALADMRACAEREAAAEAAASQPKE